MAHLNLGLVLGILGRKDEATEVISSSSSSDFMFFLIIRLFLYAELEDVEGFLLRRSLFEKYLSLFIHTCVYIQQKPRKSQPL